MEGGCDLHVEWNNLLERGDAAALFAVFREAINCASSDRTTLVAIATFLETHLFTAVLEVDLGNLCRTESMESLDAALRGARLPPLDAREALTELLAIGDFRDGYVLSVYLRLVRAALRQLFFDTVQRRRDCISVEERLMKVQAVMRAWYTGGLHDRISQILYALAQRDALPKMVRTVRNSDGDDSDCTDGDEDDIKPGNVLRSSLSTAEIGGLVEALFLMSVDIVMMIGSGRKAVSLLLNIKAITVWAQPFNEKGEYLHTVATDLRQWASLWCPVDDTKTEVVVPHSPTESPTAILEQQRVFVQTGGAVTRALLEVAPFGEAISLVVDGAESGFCRDLMGSVTHEDDELGKDATDAKTLVTLRDLKDEKDALRVLSDDDNSENEENDVSPETVSLQRSGAMLMLYDMIALDASRCHMVFSSSPTNFFFLSGPMVLESLKGASLSAVMTGLAFLAMVLPHVPLYSLRVRGEMSEEAEKIYELRRQNVCGDSLSFRTKRFELLFELVKSLINILSTCPSENHRVIARAIFTLLIRCCAADLRILIYSSFLVLTPFASICSLMLRFLSEEWDSTLFSGNRSEKALFRRSLPRCLLQAQENWLRRLRIGEVSFVDPMVQSLGFVRLVIAGDSRRASGDALFLSESKDGKLQLRGKKTKDDEGRVQMDQCENWDGYLKRLLGSVVPSLRAVVNTASEKSSTSRIDVLHAPNLTPLDCFSLTMALDGLEEQVVFAPRD